MTDQVSDLLRAAIDRRELREIAIIFRLGGEGLKERQALVITDSAYELLV
jgi:hypothetical protein